MIVNTLGGTVTVKLRGDFVAQTPHKLYEELEARGAGCEIVHPQIAKGNNKLVGIERCRVFDVAHMRASKFINLR